MPLLELPEPANWRAGGLPWVRFGLVLAFAGPAIGWGVVKLLRGDYLTATVLIGLAAPFPMTLAALYLVASGRTTLRAVDDATGSTLHPDRRFGAILLTAIALVIPVGLLVIRYSPTGDLDIAVTRGWALIYFPGLAFVMVLTAVVGLINAWRRGGVGYVKLTATGYELANIALTKSGSWDDVADVVDSTEAKKTRKAIVLRLKDGTEEIVDGADFYVPNGSGLYWMVRHYWRHADDRSELTDSRALERLRQGRFDLD